MRPVLFVAHYGEATIDGKSTEFLAFDPAGDAPPEVIAGRLPRSADEVALGAGLLDELDLHLGSTATFTVAGGEFAAGGRATPRPLTVVGEALPPVFGESDFAEVGVVTLDAIAAAGGDDAPRMVLVRVGLGALGTRDRAGHAPHPVPGAARRSPGGPRLAVSRRGGQAVSRSPRSCTRSEKRGAASTGCHHDPRSAGLPPCGGGPARGPMGPSRGTED